MRPRAEDEAPSLLLSEQLQDTATVGEAQDDHVSKRADVVGKHLRVLYVGQPPLCDTAVLNPERVRGITPPAHFHSRCSGVESEDLERFMKNIQIKMTYLIRP